MSSSYKSAVISSPNKRDIPKPSNVFFIWYAELCRRSKINPLPSVKPPKPKNDAVLDFNADRVKLEDWDPLLNALRLDTSLHVISIKCRMDGIKFLYDIDTKDKIKLLKRRFAFLWTDYILKSLINSLNCCINNTQVLSTLELDGLPLSGEYFELLLRNLKHNRTIKVLSLAHCPISDVGCEQLCTQLRFMHNVEVLNLSSCSLGVSSAICIANIIKHQQLNRYSEIWHNSLRYKDPSFDIMTGLKRITLNYNPNIGDDGLCLILKELEDDLWIKALDMQKCNISEKMSSCLIDLVTNSKSLIIADFRNNERLSKATLDNIFDIILKKHGSGIKSDYQWCGTTTTLFDLGCCDSSRSSISGTSSHVQKSKSAALLGQIHCDIPGSKVNLRKTQTVMKLNEKAKRNIFFTNPYTVSKKELDCAKKQLIKLKAEVELEVRKRKQTEKKNAELELKLKDFEKLGEVKQITENKNVKESCVATTSRRDKKSLKPKLSMTRCDPQITRKISSLRPKMPKNGDKSKHVVQPVCTPKTTVELDVSSLVSLYLNKDRKEDTMEEEQEFENVLHYLYTEDADKSGRASKAQIRPSDKKNNNNNYISKYGSNASLEHLLLKLFQQNSRPTN